ncbi:MAG: FAD-dependent oxidoreductase [Haloferula sp.]
MPTDLCLGMSRVDGKRTLKVAIVGCGSAGPAAATLLARRGHEVRLFERAAECRPVGAGFLLQPSGLAVLDELGVLDGVMKHGGKIERLHVLDVAGHELLDLRYQELGSGHFGLGLHRPVLLHYLLEAMAGENVPVTWGWEVTEVKRLSDGWTLTATDGRTESGFDLVIGADGARSVMRETLGGADLDRGYAWGAHWFIGRNEGAFPIHDLHQVVDGTRYLAGFLATGRELGGEDDLVSLFWSVRLDEDAAWRARPLDEWKQEVLRVVPRARPLLDQIHDWSQVLTARYGDVRMKQWHGDDWVLLGDAGHAMSPQLGQGVNLALADASCLVCCLDELPLPDALRVYSRRRRRVLRYYGFSTRQLTPWFQSDYEFLDPIRHFFFRLMQCLPPARKFMTRTMAGMVGAQASCQSRREGE